MLENFIIMLFAKIDPYRGREIMKLDGNTAKLLESMRADRGVSADEVISRALKIMATLTQDEADEAMWIYNRIAGVNLQLVEPLIEVDINEI